MREVFRNDDTEGILLTDATNAFNSLNRTVALYNIQHLCPSFSTILINTYRSPACLYVDGDVLYSEEGTTHFAMPFYALATVPMIKKLTARVTQVWYADNAVACGKISDLREWWNQVSSLGPSFGYFPNANKTWLVTKQQYCSIGREIFSDTTVNVTSDLIWVLQLVPLSMWRSFLWIRLTAGFFFLKLTNFLLLQSPSCMPLTLLSLMV